MRKLLAAGLAFAVASCSVGDDKDAAEQAAAQVHQAFSAGQFAAVYDGSAPEMKSSLTRDQFVQTFGAIYARTGAYRSGKTTGWRVNYDTAGNFVALAHDAQFQNAHATEEFVFRMQGGKAILAGYHVKTDLPVQ